LWDVLNIQCVRDLVQDSNQLKKALLKQSVHHLSAARGISEELLEGVHGE